MVTLQNSPLRGLSQWLEINFTAAGGSGSARDLPAIELMSRLEGYGVLINDRKTSGLLHLDMSVACWTPAIRAQVAELLRRLDQNPLTQINELLEEFISTSELEPDAEQLQEERDTVAKLIQSEVARIEAIRDGSHEGPARQRERLRELLDRIEMWQASMLNLAQSLKHRAAEIDAWQVIADIARDLDLQESNASEPPVARNIPSLLEFTDHLLILRTIIGDTESAATPVGVIDCRSMPGVVERMIRQRAHLVADDLETFRRLPAKEAEACLHRMYAMIGDNKFISAGASGGLLGAFAYAASLRDLEDRGLAIAGLISTVDVAGFVVRSFVPFVLLLLIFLGLAGSWVAALYADQRKTLQYLSSVARPLLLCSAFGWLLYEWVDPTTDSVRAGACLGAVVIGALGMILWLGIVGRKAGVEPDDKVQLIIVGSLRACSRPLGSLLLLAVIGLQGLS